MRGGTRILVVDNPAASIATQHSPMIYRKLGRTGLEVSLVGLGTGGPSRIGQRTHGDEPQSQRLIHRALELGINLFDTAADYSDSEEILGRALAGVPRDRFVLATKFPPAEDDSVVTPEQMVASCERSLRRLQLETIDVFQFHGVVPELYRETVERLYPTAQRLQQQGKVRFLGITEFFFKDPAHRMLEAALQDDLWDTMMVKYGILNMAAEHKVLPLAQQHDVGVLNMSAVRVRMSRPGQLEQVIAGWKQRGLIAADALPEADPLGFLVHGDVKSVVEAGYRFGASHPAVSSLLVGTGNIAHLEENVATVLSGSLPDDDVCRLREVLGELAEFEGPDKFEDWARGA